MPSAPKPLNSAAQRVLITAAGSGIGLQTARDFVAAGAQVFICDANPRALESALQQEPRLGGMLCDVSEEAQVTSLFAQGSGAIINLSSTAGLYRFPRRAPYASAKWAIRGHTKTLAQELGPLGVRVNCVCPGSMEGDRMDRVIAAEDISNTIRFLASEQGARISGQEIVVDGHTETL